MGQSSYVTSVKARQMEEAQDDISDIEAQYGAALAEKIYDTLYKYDQMSLNAQQYNAEAHAAAQKTALSMASDWYNQYLSQQNAAIAAQRKSQAGTGDRSGKIRTYNFPQNRVTDHRLTGDVKNFNIAAVINGDLDPLVDALTLADQARRLQEGAEKGE